MADEKEKADNPPSSCSCPTNLHSRRNESFILKYFKKRFPGTNKFSKGLMWPSKTKNFFWALSETCWAQIIVTIPHKTTLFPLAEALSGFKACMSCITATCTFLLPLPSALDSLTTWFTAHWSIVKWPGIRTSRNPNITARCLWKLTLASPVSLFHKSTLACWKQTWCRKRWNLRTILHKRRAVQSTGIGKRTKGKKDPRHAAVLSVSPPLNPVVPRQPILKLP